MTTRRFQRDGETLEQLREQIRRELGPRARIVSIEKVTVGGIAGFLARHRFEATVEVDEPDGPTLVPQQHGIAALIADAEQAESSAAEYETEYEVSTSGESFEQVMRSLTAQTAEPVVAPASTPTGGGAGSPASAFATTRVTDAALPSFPAHRALPEAATPEVSPLSAPGDLIVFVGIGDASLEAARTSRGLLAAGGRAAARGIRSLDDRRAAYLARADAVSASAPVALAWGLGGALAGEDELHGIAALQPDQVWVVVDATRKAEDTARWVGLVDRVVGVDAMLVTGEEHTASPETVRLLGVPRGRLGGS
ncbi:hypothetical protein SAMN04489806_2061 [Paramicrobacterium humi]|uniref:Uncharacterized protein n=1 Tax=Paramicrobacterium humi TaxID=640635 RepID=A0A1H4N2H8_9MICO|nr:hypothetical protein [Microbacterium humi]SEB89423.1 hypothetical protein SAMN04489806_2061 [Microbacterium humi]